MTGATIIGVVRRADTQRTHPKDMPASVSVTPAETHGMKTTNVTMRKMMDKFNEFVNLHLSEPSQIEIKKKALNAYDDMFLAKLLIETLFDRSARVDECVDVVSLIRDPAKTGLHLVVAKRNAPKAKPSREIELAP